MEHIRDQILELFKDTFQGDLNTKEGMELVSELHKTGHHINTILEAITEHLITRAKHEALQELIDEAEAEEAKKNSVVNNAKVIREGNDTPSNV
jgi:uncharacterized protein YbjQ (UPF0145 family)|tara:strand:+ start:43 stop:324 length:282 start_codon:yes stop_codon:yes gene_type:complete